MREAAPYLGLGTSLAAAVGLGVGLGYWLDARLGTQPVLLLLGVALGLLAAGLQFVKALGVRTRTRKR